MTVNPYSAPTSMLTASESDKKADATLMAIARSVFLAWEKLRIIYVIILALVTLLLTGPAGFLNWRLLQLIVGGAVAANIAYFAGPTLETYVRWLGYDRMWPRWIMFGCGTLLSIILAIGSLANELLPNQP